MEIRTPHSPHVRPLVLPHTHTSPTINGRTPNTSHSDLLMAQVFVLDALDFAGDLMPLVQPPAEAGTTAEDRFLNIYLVRLQLVGRLARLCVCMPPSIPFTPPPPPRLCPSHTRGQTNPNTPNPSNAAWRQGQRQDGLPPDALVHAPADPTPRPR